MSLRANRSHRLGIIDISNRRVSALCDPQIGEVRNKGHRVDSKGQYETGIGWISK
jgi:hypothetical protein